MRKLKTVYIKTFGCQMNEYDSSRLFDLLAAAFGVKKTQIPEEADLLLLNTCSVREKAEDKVFSDLGRWRILKQQNPDLLIGVGGCVASQEGTNILRQAPFVDLIFGPQTLHKVPSLIKQVMEEKVAQIDLAWTPIEKFDNLPAPAVDGPCAYLSIMEGCNKYCSYCIVPYTRGYEVSRDFVDVLKEAKYLADQGVIEITLLGQNVNAYRSYTADQQAVDLAILLQYLAEIPGIERLRFMTSHPKELSEQLILAFASIPKLADHLHLPMQSGADLILNKMKRGYTYLEYKEKVTKLRKLRPNISISTDLIVGFPGEREKDFLATLNAIEQIGFDYSYSFMYSPRPGTPAANYPDQIPLAVKKQRLKLVQEQILKNSLQISQTMVGTIQDVIVYKSVEQNSELLSGRTANNRAVKFAGSHDLVGKLVKTKITANLGNNLQGVLY